MSTLENNVATIISVELFSKSVNDLENRIKSSRFKTELKYDSEKLNNYLFSEFKEITNVLQTVVNEFYVGQYEISGFQFFSLNDFEFCINHNLGLINNCKKLIKFIG